MNRSSLRTTFTRSVKPDKGVLMTHGLAVKNGAVSIRLPAFTDDIAVHIYRDSR